MRNNPGKEIMKLDSHYQDISPYHSYLHSFCRSLRLLGFTGAIFERTGLGEIIPHFVTPLSSLRERPDNWTLIISPFSALRIRCGSVLPIGRIEPVSPMTPILKTTALLFVCSCPRITTERYPSNFFTSA